MAKWKFLGGQTENEFMEEARLNFHRGLDADRVDRDEARHDVKFYAGGDNQWDQQSLELRRPADQSKPKRPVLTWNRLHGPVYQVCNDGRQNKPSIHVSQGDGGDAPTEEYFASRIRQIEYESDADIAYDTVREQVAVGGRGFLRILTDYENPDSFNQKIIIRALENQFSAVWDPAGVLYDRADCAWWFVIGKLSEEEYERKYGKEALENWTSFAASNVEFSGDWRRLKGLVPEVEYWKKVQTQDTLWEMPDKTTKFQSDMIRGVVEQLKAAGFRSRPSYKVQIVQFMIDGASILEEKPWAGSRIPIIPMWGDYLVVEDEFRTFSVIRHAKDPQKIVNLTVSNIAELTQNIPKTRVMVAEGQLQGHEAEWVPNSPYLFKQYKTHDPLSGKELPPPIPDQSEPPIQALSAQLAQAVDATKQGTNVFSAALGDRSNETSGKAIDARRGESDMANFHVHDNEARTRKTVGEILLEMIPKLDAHKQEVPVRSIEGKVRMVPLRAPFKDDKGRQVVIDPDKGRYNVVISTGPSFTSQRHEAAEAYGEIAKADKNFMAVAGDLFFRNLDAPGSEEIADRYEQVVIPPEVRKPKDGQPQIPPEAQQAMMQADQSIQQLNDYARQLEGKLQELQTELKARLQQTQMEIESKEKLTELQEQTKREIAFAEMQSKEAIEKLKLEVEVVTAKLEAARAEREFQMQREIGDRDRDDAFLDAESNRQHEERLAEREAKQKKSEKKGKKQ